MIANSGNEYPYRQNCDAIGMRVTANGGGPTAVSA